MIPCPTCEGTGLVVPVHPYCRTGAHDWRLVDSSTEEQRLQSGIEWSEKYECARPGCIIVKYCYPLGFQLPSPNR